MDLELPMKGFFTFCEGKPASVDLDLRTLPSATKMTLPLRNLKNISNPGWFC